MVHYALWIGCEHASRPGIIRMLLPARVSDRQRDDRTGGMLSPIMVDGYLLWVIQFSVFTQAAYWRLGISQRFIRTMLLFPSPPPRTGNMPAFFLNPSLAPHCPTPPQHERGRASDSTSDEHQERWRRSRGSHVASAIITHMGMSG